MSEVLLWYVAKFTFVVLFVALLGLGMYSKQKDTTRQTQIEKIAIETTTKTFKKALRGSDQTASSEGGLKGEEDAHYSIGGK